MIRQLIVTADDFGLCPGVNRGIVEAHKLGIVTGTSLMVNMPFAQQALELAAETPRLTVGLHLNLTAGTPLTHARHLVDGHGRLLPLPRLLSALTLDPRAAREAEAEWEAQAEAFLQLSPRLAALDSHHHLHMHPRLLRYALTLARRLDVPLRWPQDRFRLGPGDWLDVKATMLTALAALHRKELRKAGVVSTDAFCGLHLMGPRFTLPHLRRMIERLRPGSTELMCHPGRVDAELRARSSYAEPRAGELAVLTNSELRETVLASGVELRSWTEVRAQARSPGSRVQSGNGGPAAFSDADA